MGNLAGTLLRRGDHAAAEPLFREAMALQRKLLGNEHPRLAASLIDLASLLRYKGDNAGAELLCREALALRRKLLGEEHPDTLSAGDDLAGLLQRRGSLEESETLRRALVEIARRSLGDDHPKTLRFVNNHATVFSNWAGMRKRCPVFERRSKATGESSATIIQRR